jgi:acetyl esterase/lipase
MFLGTIIRGCMLGAYMDTLERQLIDDQRRFFTDVLGARPLPDDARLTESSLGGVAALEILVGDRPPRATMLWLHGGGYVGLTTDRRRTGDRARPSGGCSCAQRRLAARSRAPVPRGS